MDYVLRDIKDELWRRAKHVAVDERITLKELCLRALREYVEAREEER